MLTHSIATVALYLFYSGISLEAVLPSEMIFEMAYLNT